MVGMYAKFTVLLTKSPENFKREKLFCFFNLLEKKVELVKYFNCLVKD